MKPLLFCGFLFSLFLATRCIVHEIHKTNIRNVQRYFALQSRLRHPGANWEAGENGLTDKDPKDLRSLCGAIIPNHIGNRDSHHPPPPLSGSATRTAIPAEFDASKKWPSCTTIKHVRDQGQACGSCWAFAGAGVISDRYCIASRGTKTKIFSPQDMLVCDGGHGRPENVCQAGGILQKPYIMLVRGGVVSGGDYMSGDGCMPYTLYHGSASWNDLCTGVCTNPNSGLHFAQDKTYGSTWYEMGNAFSGPSGPAAGLANESVVRQIQLELMARGPLSVGFRVYDDFLTYKSGVYQYVTGNPVYGHAMKLIGWGSENGTDYWLIVNSWGREWGMDGLVKIIRGIDHLGIENRLVTAMVDPGLKRPIGTGKTG